MFSSAADTFNVATGGVERMELGATTIFNEDGADVDFRIEGDTNANLFYVDAGNDRVGIGVSSPDTLLHVSGTNNGAILSLLRLTNTGGSANTEARIEFELSSNFTGYIGQTHDSGDTGSLVFGNKTAHDAAPSEKMRITAAGDVGIGISPAAALHVYKTGHYVVTDSGKASKGIHVRGNPGNAGEFGGGISFSCGDNDSSSAIAARQGDNDSDVIGLSFFTHPSTTATDNAVEKVRIHHGGVTSFNDGICLGNGVTLSSSQTLNDYEEGTWTPDWRGGSALGTTSYGSHNSASYVKIGNQVTVRGFSEISGSSGGSGFWFINNLPFTVGGGDDRRYRSVGSVMIENFNFNSDVTDVVIFIERNNNDAQLRSNRDSAGAGSSISVNNDANFEIVFTITYPTV